MTLEFQEMMEDMRQKPIKTRGHGTYDPATGKFNFIPSLPGEPVQKAVRKLGESKLYETEGEKHSSIIVHLKVDRNTADPRTELFDQLEHLTRPLAAGGEEPLAPPRKCLESTDVLKIWHNRRTRKIVVQMEIATDTGRDPSDALFQLSAATNKCFAINRKSFSTGR